MAVVSGRIQIREYTDKEGNKRKVAEIVTDNIYFGDSRRTSDSSVAVSGGYQNDSGSDDDYSAPVIEPDFTEIEDDGELPF